MTLRLVPALTLAALAAFALPAAAQDGFAGQYDIALRIEPFPPNAGVLADEDRLMQVMTNLLSNAIKYQDPAVSAFVRISADVVNGALRLSVRDNGLGIPPEQRGKLFEMFKRFHAHVVFGTGLVGGTAAGTFARFVLGLFIALTVWF